MLTDEEIAELSTDERRQLMKRLAAPLEDILPSETWLRRTREIRVVVLTGGAVLLVPWVAYLAFSLPRRYVAHNWDKTWVGFDLLLLTLMVLTSVLGYHRRQMVMLTAFATGVLLLCDAWFDVMTSNDVDRTWSLVTALLIELPVAVMLITGPMQMLRLVAARLWALDKGEHAWQVRIPLPSDADMAVHRNRRGSTAHS